MKNICTNTQQVLKRQKCKVRMLPRYLTGVADMLKGDETNEPMNLNQVVTRLTLRDMLERGEDDDETIKFN